MTRIHASELTKPDGLCPRAYALHDVTKKKPRGGWLTTSEQMTYQMGRDQERNIVNWFADMGKAVCHWRCLSCNHLHEFQGRPYKCESCSFKVFKNEEVRFESAITGASCGVDMLLALGEPKLRPVELKTMAADQFKALQAPLAEHRLRTNFYMRIIDESSHSWSNMVGHDKATIVYVSKSAYGCADDSLRKWGIKEGFSPLKEYDIKRNDAETNVLADRSKVVKDYRAGLVGMPCGVCSTAMSKRAGACAFKGECFSGEYPASYVWKGAPNV